MSPYRRLMTISRRLKELNHNQIIAMLFVMALVVNTLTMSVQLVRQGQVENIVMAWQVFIIVGAVWTAYKL